MAVHGAGGLVVYVTSHGFGHLNRTVAVLNRLPTRIPVTIRCHEDLFPRWRERLQRPATLEPGVWDSGAVNPSGDSNATDGPETLRRAEEMMAAMSERVDAEADRLRAEPVTAVLCDAPPLPLVAAHRAGVPGFLLANFTWSEIYRVHALRAGPEAMDLVGRIRRAYRHATVVFRAEPALRLDELQPQMAVGLVVSPGHDRRRELIQSLNLPEDVKLVYSYLGRYGQDGPWQRLERLGDRGIHFVSFAAPGGRESAPANWHVIEAARWTGADLAASTDVVLAKAGYGTVCEAMAHRRPLIYPPRHGFAEHHALDRSLRAWGGGVPLRGRDFRALRVERALDEAFQLRPGPPPYPADGASRIAERLAQSCDP